MGVALKARFPTVATYDAAREQAIRLQRWKEVVSQLTARRAVTSNTSDPRSFLVQQIYLPTSISTSNSSGAADYFYQVDTDISFYLSAMAFDTLKSGSYSYSSPVRYVTDIEAKVPNIFVNAPLGPMIAPIAITAPPMPLSSSANIELERLVGVVRDIFPKATIALTTQSDDEEGWSRPMLRVETGVDDPEKLRQLEQEFYEEVDGHESLTAALNATTVFFM